MQRNYNLNDKYIGFVTAVPGISYLICAIIIAFSKFENSLYFQLIGGSLLECISLLFIGPTTEIGLPKNFFLVLGAEILLGIGFAFSFLNQLNFFFLELKSVNYFYLFINIKKNLNFN